MTEEFDAAGVWEPSNWLLVFEEEPVQITQISFNDVQSLIIEIDGVLQAGEYSLSYLNGDVWTYQGGACSVLPFGPFPVIPS